MFSLTVILFLVVSAFIFWVGIFVLTSNPFNTLSRVGAALLFTSSIFFLTGAFIYSAGSVEETRFIFKSSAFAVYLSAVLWCHVSVLLSDAPAQRKWFGVLVLGYFLGVGLSVLETSTNLVFDYDTLAAPISRFKFIFSKGPLFYPAAVFIVFYASLSSYNLLQLYLGAKDRAKCWFKYTFPLVASVLFTIGFLTLLVPFIFTHSTLIKSIAEVVLGLSILLLAANVFANRLFLDGARSNFGREFVYSTITVFGLSIIYLGLIFIFNLEVSINKILFISIFIFVLLSTHTLYDWIMSFVRNIFYRGEVFIPRVTDEEISLALRNYNKPSRLEQSTLLRLRVVNNDVTSPVDRLRDLIKESIAYFKLDDSHTRSRASLKYFMLKHIADQVEEGQILWDLGFEEYPLEIAERAEGRKPRFAITSPTDYQATSRNAFINLKKEAIHDLAWRISYLEKHQK